jgi:hypothetical protein
MVVVKNGLWPRLLGIRLWRMVQSLVHHPAHRHAHARRVAMTDPSDIHWLGVMTYIGQVLRRCSGTPYIHRAHPVPRLVMGQWMLGGHS